MKTFKFIIGMTITMLSSIIIGWGILCYEDFGFAFITILVLAPILFSVFWFTFWDCVKYLLGIDQ